MGGSSKTAAIVGVGMIGAVHARAVRAAGGTVRGVLASSPERGEVVSKEWDVELGYRELAEVVSDPAVDVVHICTPNEWHAEQAEAVLRAGKPVVCEKPLATSVADAERIGSTAAETGLVAAVPFVYRYHPLVREIRARAEGGEFGAWQLLHGSYLQDWMLPPASGGWRVDPDAGGVSRAFADIGSHWCDLVEWVAGVRFGSVNASLATTVPIRDGKAVRTEDVAALLLRTTEGTLGNLTVSQVSAGRKNRLWFELDGEHASAVFDQENPESIWLGDLDGGRRVVRAPERGSAEQRRLSVLPGGHPQGYADAFTAFVSDAYAAIDGEYREGLPTAADGVRSARLIEAALASAAESTWKEIRE